MSHYLDPIAAVEQPRQDFIRYLLTAYPLRDPHLRYGLEEQLKQPGTIWQYPYLEGSQPYQTTKSVSELVKLGVLHPDVKHLFTPAQRPLYKHQEQAVRAVVEQQQNIVVATGTGSGKTECFLIPIMNRLLQEGATSLRSNPGVRVLILYPMNALVNDQVKRLRQLLCQQQQPLIRFGFYTSRTERDPQKARQALKEELEAYDPQELRKLFTAEDLQSPDFNRPESLVQEAIRKIQDIQAISREEIWENPPQILLTNYSMLEHMLIRPKERTCIFEASRDRFQLLVVDEAHTYDGSTGTEVSMLLKRLKAAVGIETKGKLRCIATSASLGDKSVDSAVIKFAEELFGESFNPVVVRGDRVEATQRLGHPYPLPDELQGEPLWEYIQALKLPSLNAPIEEWWNELSYFVPVEQLQRAGNKVADIEQPENQVRAFLWEALKQHPLFHRLINSLRQKPQPWHVIARSEQLWGIELPKTLDGSLDPGVEQPLERALAYLVQLGTLARQHLDDLPLLPVRLHLLFRSIEGLYACTNPQCPGAVRHPNYAGRPHRYGQLYLSEKSTCEHETCQSPVLELASCRKCGQAYSLACLAPKSRGVGLLQPLPRSLEAITNSKQVYTLTVGALDSVTEDEAIEVPEDDDTFAQLEGTFMIRHKTDRSGWEGIAMPEAVTATTSKGEVALKWHIPPVPSQTKKADIPPSWAGGYLSRCPACGARDSKSPSLGRFVSYTDAPLEVMLDSLFELLPDSEPNWRSEQPTKRKLLTFSDGRQDAAFFASDFQRTHTETLYRQMVWQAFQDVKDETNTASVKQVEDQLTRKFLDISLPHPDRRSELHHLSYVANDPDELIEENRSKNPRDCRDRAQKRAKELLLREFGLPSARRFSLEALGLLSCHIDIQDRRLPEAVAQRFQISPLEAKICLRGLTNIMRQAGIIDLQGASDYFPETGGVEDVRPGALDAQGRSRTRLKLQKDKGEKDVVSFLWRTNDKTGEPTKRQNHLVTYYRQILGESIRREDMTWLYQQLVSSGWLTKCAKGGHQLNWELLNIVATDRHWYQCRSCQQRFHIPDLGEIFETTKLGFKHCPAYRCEGSLQPLIIDPKPNPQQEADHYRYLIRQRSITPLRSQEHTAQLSVVELEKRENRFRQGKINLLSSSTTLEMGVDIGELQAVALRNFPPHVSNYQQRVGRAGRRTDGVAVTLMYGQRRPHDRFYFDQPTQLIAGKNQIPKLNPQNFHIQQRHIRAELLATFLRERRGTGAENIQMAEFLGFSCEDFTPVQDSNLPPNALIIELREWLNSQTAQELTGQWLQHLGNHQAAPEILAKFGKDLSDFEQSQLQDWNQLAEVLAELDTDIRATKDRKLRREMEYKRDRIEEELEKVAKRRLHDELAQASILPIYGFPIDVVRLLTGQSNKYKSSQGRHRLERDRRLALGEYAPGQDVVVDDRVHHSIGVLRPENLEHQYYWVCQNCNYFDKSKQEKEPFTECPECKSSPQTPSEQKMREYVVPKTFTTDWSQQPKVTPYTKPLRQPTSQVFLAQEGDNPESLGQPHWYQLTFSQGGLFFLANQGPLVNGRGFKNRGFAICKSCGCDLSTQLQERQRSATSKKSRRQSKTTSTSSSQIPHSHPITGKPCSGKSYSLLHLGHEFRSDLLKIRFAPALIGNRLLYEPVIHFGDSRVISSSIAENSTETVTGIGFWHSLTYALLAAAAQVIDVPRSELDGLFKPTEGGSGLAEIVIYDNVPGGAGYSKRIAQEFQDMLQKADELVESCSCDSSCYDCLRTYSNQMFHAELNRHIVADFLKPLVEQVKPDQELQVFAPHASRISLTKMADRLRRLCRMAGSASLLYLPQLNDGLGLDRGSPMPWLGLLADAVNSMHDSSTALELVVNQLPKPNSDANRAIRKRLYQWIDQGLLKLYESSYEALPILCFSTQQPHRIALKLHQRSDQDTVEWFQTQSAEGVETVESRLQTLRSQARLVPASELADPDTIVVFPEPSWGELSLPQLRQKLGIDGILASQVKQVFYRDRYLNGQRANFLAELLQGEGLSANSQVTILTLETSQSPPASELKAELEAALIGLKAIEIQPKVTVQPRHRRSDFPHARELEIQGHDQQKYKVIFDRGLDFLEKVENRETYRIKHPTYIAIIRQQ
ncbi:MAG: DEAD/DEAH box helicase [Coleofasciculus sp. B1-GNL1-01]|uniref:DEAD/DEAH box helicase n=1 Tax=Coleofasciculus sp. B1-GNL1-01 TaxID=3068484 RepID=UPI003303FA6A